MKKFLLIAVAASLLTTGLQAQTTTIADWTFETSQPTTAGPLSPEVGAGAATGFHAGTTTYSTPAGNGSSHSFSSTNWAVGDYYQFSVSTLNLQDLQLSFDQTSSNTGPKDFELEYSTNGTTFTNVASYSVLANASPNPVWNSTTSSSLYTTTEDLSSITALDNDATVYFRLVDADTTSANGGTVASGGTDRVDNFVVSGIAATPEPSSWTLGGIALATAAFLRLRRRSA